MSIKLNNFVKNECCNYVRSECVGMSFTEMFSNDGICVLIKKDKPESCDFFKRVVLPLAKYSGSYNEINNSYSAIDKKVKRVKDRYCGCGKLLEKSERLCIKCNKKRVKEKSRERNKINRSK